MTLIVVGSLSSISGGYIYDSQLVSHLRRCNDINVNVVEIHEPSHPLFSPQTYSKGITKCTDTKSDEHKNAISDPSLIWPEWWPANNDPTLTARTTSIFASIPSDNIVLIDGMAVIELSIGLAAMRQTHAKLIYLIHYPFACETDCSLALKQLCHEQERIAFASAHSFIAASNVSRHLIHHTFGIPLHNITAVAPGIDKQTFQLRLSSTASPQLQPSTILADTSPVSSITTTTRPIISTTVRYICVANGFPRKNLLWLLECFSSMTKKQYHNNSNSIQSTDTSTITTPPTAVVGDWSLQIIGNFGIDHDYMTRVRHRIDDDIYLHDRVKLINGVPPHLIVNYYRDAHVFVFASIFENYGMAIAEAVEMGLPIITTRVGEASTICPHESWYAIHSPPTPFTTVDMYLAYYSVLVDVGNRDAYISALASWTYGTRTHIDPNTVLLPLSSSYSDLTASHALDGAHRAALAHSGRGRNWSLVADEVVAHCWSSSKSVVSSSVSSSLLLSSSNTIVDSTSN
jgi:glycosyltransferase involved in cell wall biosynthesis